ncbi:hypothetical protein GCM10023201_18510 [Actinomycetospora corticicola]|uniref:Biotin synthase auxiliary protein n=1 Tax=Actinomycetospora corticicola TaxID=663602 RepID=A0A7Y9DUQ8_9PSEU|nr:hypothetical protein [Actinomycetospora corticicola]
MTRSGAELEPEAESAVYCSFCGGETASGDHERCRARLSRIDPPRYCAECARKMVVQVDPMGWTARCSRHGERTSAEAAQR